MRQAGSFLCYAFEGVVDERVHDAHGFAGNANIGVNLFQDVIDVDTVGFPSRSLAVPNPTTLPTGTFSSFLATFGACFTPFVTVGVGSDIFLFRTREE